MGSTKEIVSRHRNDIQARIDSGEQLKIIARDYGIPNGSMAYHFGKSKSRVAKELVKSNGKIAIPKKGRACKLYSSKRNDFILFHKLIYSNCDLFLRRKKEKFDELIHRELEN